MATAAPFPVAPHANGASDDPRRVARIVVVAYGLRVAIEADDPGLLERLRACLPPASHEIVSGAAPDLTYSVTSPGSAHGDGEPPACYIGRAGAVPFAQTADEAALLAAFESAVRFDIAVATTGWTFVHAGVVGWNNGAIVIPAPSMHGKSRLVEALVRAGATYYSDEFALLDAGGAVHPFPIPLSLRNTAGGTDRVAAAGGAHLPALPLRAVVSTRYEPGGKGRLRTGTPGEALLALFANTVRARVAPAETLSVLGRAVGAARLLEGPRGEADEFAPRLLRLCR